MAIERISAVTLAVQDMARALAFYRTVGFELLYGGEAASFSSFQLGSGHLNLVLAPEGFSPSWWGRVIFYVDDVDALYRRLVDVGLTPSTEPQDASWGERYFHINDPDGHELSFARPLDSRD